MARATSGELEDSAAVDAADAGADDDVSVTASTLPAGMVTFVMTDIEGSTRLFRKLGDEYAELLDTHRRLLRQAFSRHRGAELGTEGDSFLVAFGDAAAAIAACVEGQRALLDHAWPPGADVRVRMGVHTGEAAPTGNDYVSLALHQVARIGASAHGGQVLVSDATLCHSRTRLPPQVELVPVGSYQLRGFVQPEKLYQVHHPKLPTHFPPPRALGVVAHNLPYLRSAFIGRTSERAALAALLRHTGVVSVVGMGGVGKTRLAIQVGFDIMDAFSDGAWLVEIGPLSDPASVPRAVAIAMGIADAAGQTTEQVLEAALATKTALIILDNCEHLLDAASRLAERLSQQCPHLTIVATTREPLDIEGEVVFRIGPFPTPPATADTPTSDLAGGDAVRLFVARAEAVHPGFALTDENAASVARIVTRLNGIPLAIELAAATLLDRTLDGILEGLGDRFALLTHGRRTAPRRHQTLRAALEWSLDLLRPAERRLFARLSAFTGRGSHAAAAAVCGWDPIDPDDVVAMIRRLVRASLLTADPEFPDRWSMLESLRELAAIELEAVGEVEIMAERHRTWYLTRVEALSALVGQRGGNAMRDITDDRTNIRRAIAGATAAGDADIALRMGVALTPYWRAHGDWTEGSQRLSAALALGDGRPGLRSQAEVALGNLLLLRGQFDEAGQLFAAAADGARRDGDELTAASALAGCGFVSFRHSELDRAQTMWREALAVAERNGDDRTVAAVLRNLAIAAGSGGNQSEVEDLLQRATAAAQRAGDDQLLRLLLASTAEMHLWKGNYEAAESIYGEALAVADDIGDLAARPLLLAELGWVGLLRGDLATAKRLSVDAAELAEDLGNPRVLAHAHRLRGETLLHMGDGEAAASILEVARLGAEELGAPAELAGVLCSLAYVHLEHQRFDEAADLADLAHAEGALRHGMRRISPEWVLGVVSLCRHDHDGAERHFRHGIERATYAKIPRHEANGQWGLAMIAEARGEVPEAIDRHARSITLRHDIGDQLGLAESLIGMARTIAAVDPQSAAELIGAASAIWERAGAVPTPRIAGDLAWAKSRIGSSEEDEAYAGGRKLSAGDAVATALRAGERLMAAGGI